MANLGSIGINTATVPSVGVLMGAPWWHDPSNRAIGIKNQDSKGPEPAVGGYFGGGTPVDQVTVVISNFGQSGAGVSIF